MKNLVATVFLLSLFIGSVIGAELRFEATDVDGALSGGAIVSLDAERLVLQVENEQRDIPLDRLETLSSPEKNPYFTPEESARASAQDAARTPTRPAPGRQLPIPITPPKQSETGTKTPTVAFPDSVIVVDLTDGSRLVAVSLTMKGKSVRIRLLSDEEIDIPLPYVGEVRFGVPNRSSVDAPAEAWNRLADASERKGDRLVVGKDDALDLYEGVVLEISDETVTFSVDGDTLPVPRRRVAGLLFHHDPEARKNLSTEKSPGRLDLWDGSRIRLSSLNLSEDGDALVWTGFSGFSGRSALKTIDRLEFGRKDVLHLSDLTPGTVKQSSAFDWEKPSSTEETALDLLRSIRTRRMRVGTKDSEVRPVVETIALRTPKSASRQPKVANRPIGGLNGIVLDGTAYSKGLVVPCGTTLTFTLPESFAALRGVAGIDDRLRPEGRARLVIQTDDELLCDWEIRGDGETKTLKFELPGNARKLTLTVDFLDGLTETPVSLGDLKLIQ